MTNSFDTSREPSMDPFADLSANGDANAADPMADRPQFEDGPADTVDVDANEAVPEKKTNKAPLYAGMLVMGGVAAFMVYTALAPRLFPKSPKAAESIQEIRRETAGVVDVVKPPKSAEPTADAAPSMRADAPENMPLAQPGPVTAALMDKKEMAVPQNELPDLSSNTSSKNAKSAPNSVNASTISPQKQETKSAVDDEIRLSLIGIRESLSSMEQRLKVLEKKSEQAPQVGAAMPPSPVSRGVVQSQVSEIKRSAAPKRSERKEEVSSSVAAGPVMTGYTVSAIFPREGDFKKAWIYDGERTMTVTVGDMIGEHKVTRIDGNSMTVRTSAGLIVSRQ